MFDVSTIDKWTSHGEWFSFILLHTFVCFFDYHRQKRASRLISTMKWVILIKYLNGISTRIGMEWEKNESKKWSFWDLFLKSLNMNFGVNLMSHKRWLLNLNCRIKACYSSYSLLTNLRFKNSSLNPKNLKNSYTPIDDGSNHQ